MAVILDGKAISKEIRQGLMGQVDGEVCLTVLLVGDDPASKVYVKHKQKACGEVGINSNLLHYSQQTTTDSLTRMIGQLNEDQSVHGILVQLPLPDHIDTNEVLQAIDPLKDVDALHPENAGLIAQGRHRFLPCTPYGIIQMLHWSRIEIAGKHAVIMGRSNIVGRPLANMLIQRDATVTLCHSKTPHIEDFTSMADILVVAIGSPKFVTGDIVNVGAVVIDVGINRTEDGLVGDVDFESVSEVASHITPVPGGVGPLTVTMLLSNTFLAKRLQED